MRAYMALKSQEIADRIKELREAKGNPPQPVVAAACGVSLRTYQNWEAGDAIPRFLNLERLAEYYGVSEEFILTGTENAIRESPILVTNTVEDGFDEFRGYVSEILAKLDAAVLERDAIQQLLDEQTALLAELRNVVKVLPAIQRVLDSLPAAAGEVPPVAEPAPETATVPVAGEGRSRGTG